MCFFTWEFFCLVLSCKVLDLAVLADYISGKGKNEGLRVCAVFSPIVKLNDWHHCHFLSSSPVTKVEDPQPDCLSRNSAVIPFNYFGSYINGT